MAIQLVDLEALAKACVDGDLDAFGPTSQLGWTLTAKTRAALLQAVAQTNYHRTYSYGISSFTLVHAIGLINEAATNESGIAVTEQVRSSRLGKELAIAFRHADAVHFGVRYASNLPLGIGQLWPELKPWFKVLERNRERLEHWAVTAEGNVAVALVARGTSTSPSESASGPELLAAVIAEPDDVERRLVYADWLVGQGDVQGELIQLSEHRHALGHADESIDARIKQLINQYGERIAGEIAQLASGYSWNRGFVGQIEMSAPSFAKHGERLLASQPIRELELAPVNAKALARLATAPAVRKLRALKLSQIIGRTRAIPFDDLCRSTLFESLRELGIWTWVTEGNPLDGFARWLAPRLSALVLYEVDSSAQIVAGLARNEVVRLHSLEVDLRSRSSWPAGLLGAPAFAPLRRLRLSTRGSGSALMLERESLPELRDLQIEDDFDVDRITLPQLRRLSLDHSSLDARTLLALVRRHPRLSTLRVWEMLVGEPERALTSLLELPSDHPLRAVALPSHAVDPDLLARVQQRFTGDFHERDDDD